MCVITVAGIDPEGVDTQFLKTVYQFGIFLETDIVKVQRNLFCKNGGVRGDLAVFGRSAFAGQSLLIIIICKY